MLYIRYYTQIGQFEDAVVKYIHKRDIDDVILEEKYVICSKEIKASKKQLVITLYLTTGRILIQGGKKNEWIKREKENFMCAIKQSKNKTEAVSLYKQWMDIKDGDIEEDLSRDVIISAKKLSSEAIESALEEIEAEQSLTYFAHLLFSADKINEEIDVDEESEVVAEDRQIEFDKEGIKSIKTPTKKSVVRRKRI